MVVILLLFIFNPLFIILGFNEGKYWLSVNISLLNSLLTSILGILILSLGAIIGTLGRYQLRRFGHGVLSIQDEHQLITTGIYSFIRHPIYSGGILGIIGFYLAFQSFLLLIVLTLLYFIVLRHRLLFEEKMMIDEFGESYEEYMKQTKRLIPFIY